MPLRAPSIPADPQILDRLREVLTAAGYSEQRLWPQGREGALRDAESAVTVAPAMGERLSTLARLFLAGTAARTEEAATALAPLDLPDLQPSGVIEVDGDRTWSPLRIEPFEGLFLASDRSPAGALPADFVGGVNPFATTLAWPTIRRRVRATLDLGTGGGIQALLAAPHSENVVGVDVNPRALAFTAFNARLNGLSGVECQEGSWFEPIDRRRFDLIVANPPFIVSPDSKLLYRDGGLEGDELCRGLVQEAPEHLEDGGFAQIQCDWIVRAGEDGSAPPMAWAENRACDALLLYLGTDDCLSYAARWNRRLRDTSLADFEEAVERWVSYHRRLGVETIGSGTLVLRRRTRARNWQQTVQLASLPSGPAGDHLARLFDAQDQRAAMDGGDLLGKVLSPIEGYRLDQRLRYRDGRYLQPPAKVSLEPGLGLEAEIAPDLLALVFELDGRRALGEVIRRAASDSGRDRELLEERAVPAVRELFASGFLEQAP